MNTQLKNWLARYAGEYNCYVSSNISYKDADGTSHTGGTGDVLNAFYVANLVSKPSVPILGTYTYAYVKSINGNTDITTDDIKFVYDNPTYCGPNIYISTIGSGTVKVYKNNSLIDTITDNFVHTYNYAVNDIIKLESTSTGNYTFQKYKFTSSYSLTSPTYTSTVLSTNKDGSVNLSDISNVFIIEPAFTCSPQWQCEKPFNGYEFDGCGNRRKNSACDCPCDKSNIIPIILVITAIGIGYYYVHSRK